MHEVISTSQGIVIKSLLKFGFYLISSMHSYQMEPITDDMSLRGFSSHSGICHSYRDVTITGDGLKILTNARHSWPLSIEGSVACHTYCNTGHPFIMLISEDP